MVNFGQKRGPQIPSKSATATDAASKCHVLKTVLHKYEPSPSPPNCFYVLPADNVYQEYINWNPSKELLF
jgi:hypothetical protein